MPTVAALDFLNDPTTSPPEPICVVFGEDTFLRRELLKTLRAAVLTGDDADFSLTKFDAKADPSDVFDELSTMALFGGDRRLIVMEDADDWVTRNRGRLEAYVDKPSRSAVLALDVKTWPANTRLYKTLAKCGLQINAKTPKARELPDWLVRWASIRHDAKLTTAAAGLLVDMVGPNLGLLEQELAKLAVAGASAASGQGASSKGEITPELVSELVGSWRAKTAWDMLDAAAVGRLSDAMRELDRLLGAGETAIGVLSQIAYSLRRFAAATRLVEASEARGRRPSLDDALKSAGVHTFALRKSKEQLRQIGRDRGGQLYRWLLEADRGLKGYSQLPPRTVLETLLVRLATPSHSATDRRSAIAR